MKNLIMKREDFLRETTHTTKSVEFDQIKLSLYLDERNQQRHEEFIELQRESIKNQRIISKANLAELNILKRMINKLIK